MIRTGRKPGYKMSEETKAKIRASLLRSNHYGVGRPRNPIEPRTPAANGGNHGAIDPVGVAHWQDQRAAERAAAKVKTDALREQILNARAKANRTEARASGARTFIGKLCDRHTTGERYVSDGKCVPCTKAKNDVRAGRAPSTEKLRVKKSTRIPGNTADFWFN